MDHFQRYQSKYPNWQQERDEIDAVISIIHSSGQQVRTYLEIGTAEGGSLYYFGHRLAPLSAVCVDLDEDHTRPLREWVFGEIGDAINISLMSGDSTDQTIIDCVKAKGQFDMVFIDGGHDYATVKSDWENYGPLATKFCVFHDICLPGVKAVWDAIPERKLSIVGQGKFGMGIIFR